MSIIQTLEREEVARVTQGKKIPDFAPGDTVKYYRTYHLYQPLWNALAPDVRDKVCLSNYNRLFDAARRRVRNWERTHALKASN